MGDSGHVPSYRNFDYPRGLRRLWVVGAIIWYLYIVMANSYPIAVWVGYNYALLSEPGPIALALEREKMGASAAEGCRAATVATCWVLSIQPEDQSRQRNQPIPMFPGGEVTVPVPDCEKTQAFKDALLQEWRSRGLLVGPNGLNSEGCHDLLESSERIPFINWGVVIPALIVPLVPVVLYLTGGWIARGFRREEKRELPNREG